MAKTITKVANPLVTVNYEGGVFVSLPSTVRENCEVLRWFGHWVVDAMADRGHVRWMEADVDEGLSNLSTDMLTISVADLVRQAIAATSKLKPPEAPKKFAKGKRRRRRKPRSARASKERLTRES